MATAEYLKKYMSTSSSSSSSSSLSLDGKKRRTKKKKKKAHVGMRLVDNDAMVNIENDDGLPFDPDDAPVVVKHAFANDSDGDSDAEPELGVIGKRHHISIKGGSGWVEVGNDDDGDGGNDASPPRRRQRHDSPDASPPRQLQRHDSPDASPPRKRAPRHDSPSHSDGDGDASPPRRGRRSPSPDNDASPPRSRQRHGSPEGDASPPRRQQRHDSPDASPPRRRQRHGSPDRDGDASPPRRRQRHDSPDASPPRRANSKPGYGLLSGKELGTQLATEQKKKQEELSKMDPGQSGRDAKTVYRDRKGRRLTALEEMMKTEKGEKTEASKYEWGRGLVDKDADERAAALKAAEILKPLNRYANDEDLNDEMKEKMRSDDPMRRLVSTNKVKKGKRPMYTGPMPPPNRYGIRPGHRWDGVDRSNAFEKKYFAQQHHRNNLKDAAYAWSVEDM
eukprot:TRINITY_DN5348_c0_g1_i1.p1 TRINITY_DN5348_c0_g1~~TRINITY_DN5348_c0_g1_i1.p1  ORF type:complete len:456 (-),score=140.19 TRINITY_DN5348_c0_g1_i1:4-1350(-)